MKKSQWGEKWANDITAIQKTSLLNWLTSNSSCYNSSKGSNIYYTFREYLLYSGICFTYINSFYPLNNLMIHMLLLFPLTNEETKVQRG